MKVNLVQAVSCLDARADVDAKQVAVVGHSVGAFAAGITGAIHSRIHAMVLSGGGV